MSLDASTTEIVTSTTTLSSSTSSSTPVKVSVCDAGHADAVNVSVDGDTVTSPVSADETDNTTSEDGSMVRLTSTVYVEPYSATVLAG